MTYFDPHNHSGVARTKRISPIERLVNCNFNFPFKSHQKILEKVYKVVSFVEFILALHSIPHILLQFIASSSPFCQMCTSKWPAGQHNPPQGTPRTKATWWRGRPWRLYLIPSCHSHGSHINHCPPASRPSSTLDAICHRSLGVDMLLKSTANLPL